MLGLSAYDGASNSSKLTQTHRPFTKATCSVASEEVLLHQLYVESKKAKVVEWAQLSPAGGAESNRGAEVGTSAEPGELYNAQEARNPTRLAWEPMYELLVDWQAAHLSCHVPRNCFDAPPLLGAWVRHMRRLKAAGSLEQWKVDRLDLLGFEWSLPDYDAKWLNLYHELRRYKAQHGHTRMPEQDKEKKRLGVMMLSRWLQRQAAVLVKGKLTDQRRAMLAAVGVELQVEAQVVEAATQLQRIGEAKWRPLELCYWPEQGKLPAKGKEYPGLGYKRVRDKPPEAQQQQQPAGAQ
ncbi:hypothetical protein QJQ45_011928 [Haematococcus lacustris]|nr:hypothetical protein QJQ45_011928 [Haematococcus lacustris]